MPVTTLDPNTALIVIDLQNGIVAMAVAHPIADVIENAATLAKAFRGRGLPVVLVNVQPHPAGRADQAPPKLDLPATWFDLIPELDQQPSDILVTKHGWDAFTNTGLADTLRARGVTQVVIVGVATAIGVESSARHAQTLGFNVTLPLDAMTDRIPEAHANSIKYIFPRIAETGTTADVLALLDTRKEA